MENTITPKSCCLLIIMFYHLLPFHIFMSYKIAHPIFIWSDKRNDVFVFHKKATHCTIGFHLPTNTSNSMGASLRNHTNICPPQPKAVTMTCVNVIMTLVFSSEDVHTFLQRHSNYWGTFCAPLHWKWISWPPCHLSFASLKAIS